MKNVFKTMLLAVALISSVCGTASEKIKVEISNFSMINISLSNIEQNEKLSIRDYDGQVLFNTTLKAMPVYSKYFNLGSLKDGVYFVESETAFDIKVTPVLKNSNGISLIENSKTIFFKPQVTEKNGVVKILFMNTENTDVTISISDLENILFEEKIEAEENSEVAIKKAYDFSKLKPGSYQIYFYIGSRKFVNDIEI